MTKRNATVAEVKARIAKLTQQRDEARQQVRILENANASLKREIEKWEQYFQQESQEPIFDDPYRFREQPQPVVPVISTKKTQTVELTAKRWKAFMLVGVLLVVLGGLVVYSAIVRQPVLPREVFEDHRNVGGYLIFFGVVSYVVGKAGKFWFHE